MLFFWVSAERVKNFISPGFYLVSLKLLAVIKKALDNNEAVAIIVFHC